MIDTTSNPAPASAPAVDSTAVDSSPAPGSEVSTSAESGSVESGSSQYTEGSDFVSLPDPDVDPAGFAAALDGLTSEQLDAYNAGNVKYDKKEGQGEDGGEKAAEKSKDPAEVKQEDLDAPITADVLAKLPVNVQAKLQAAQAYQDKFKDMEFLVDPAFQQEFDALLADPRVVAVREERKRGGDFSPEVKSVVTADTVAEIAAKHGIDIKNLDGIGDPNGTKEALAKVLSAGIEEGRVLGQLQTKRDAEAAAAQEKRTRFYDDGFKNLMEKVPSLKTDLPLTDPNSPMKGFYDYLLGGINAGKITHEYIMEHENLEPLFLAYQAKNGGIQSILNKPTANMKARILEDAQQTATQKAVSLAGQKVLGQAPAMDSKFGVDGDRFIKDSAYRDSKLNSIEDPDILGQLDYLLENGKWRS